VTVKNNYIVDYISMCLYLPYAVVIHNTCYITEETRYRKYYVTC